MNQIAAILIFYSGAACISPATSGPGFTELQKVPCFELAWVPSANPYKITQEQNVISMSAPKATVKKTKPRKKWKKRKRR